MFVKVIGQGVDDPGELAFATLGAADVVDAVRQLIKIGYYFCRFRLCGRCFDLIHSMDI